MLGYTVYRTVNQLNGMFYIGVHKTADPNDSYLGSGKRLKYAIKKYGVENFVKQVLYSFETKEEAYSKEKELVTEEVLDSGKCYNLKIGGDGGWDFCNKMENNPTHSSAHSKSLLNAIEQKKLNTPVEYKKMIEAKSMHMKFMYATNQRKSIFGNPEFQKEMSNRGLERARSVNAIEKRKSTYKSIQHQIGSKNSQFGSKWITDGILNKKIKKDQEIPEGWRSGRVIKTSGEASEKC